MYTMPKLCLSYAVQETTKYSAAIIAAFESKADAWDYAAMIVTRYTENSRDNGDHCEVTMSNRHGYVITQTIGNLVMVTDYNVIPMPSF